LPSLYQTIHFVADTIRPEQWRGLNKVEIAAHRQACGISVFDRAQRQTVHAKVPFYTIRVRVSGLRERAMIKMIPSYKPRQLVEDHWR
jgi:hypothetical protein